MTKEASTPTTNGNVLDDLNAAVKAKRDEVAKVRENYLALRADLREAKSTRDTVYKLLGLEVPKEEEKEDEKDED